MRSLVRQRMVSSFWGGDINYLYCGSRITAITLASQARDKGSTPFTRSSIELKSLEKREPLDVSRGFCPTGGSKGIVL